MIRKVQYAPEKSGPAPSVSVTRDFLMSDKPLHVEASLQKQVDYLKNVFKICGRSLQCNSQSCHLRFFTTEESSGQRSLFFVVSL